MFYWKLFSELASERETDSDGGARPIKLSAFVLYASFHQFTRLDAQDAWEFVRLIDALWMEEWRKRHNAKMQASNKKLASGAK